MRHHRHLQPAGGVELLVQAGEMGVDLVPQAFLFERRPEARFEQNRIERLEDACLEQAQMLSELSKDLEQFAQAMQAEMEEVQKQQMRLKWTAFVGLFVAAASAGVALFVWGYIAPRYLADFVPFLVLASAVALADIWRRLDGGRRPLRLMTAGIIAVVGVFTISANVGMAPTQYRRVAHVL